MRSSLVCPAENVTRLLYFIGNFQKLKGNQCDCPVPCDTISFKPVLSYALFPSDNYVRLTHELDGEHSSNASESTLRYIQEYIRYNELWLIVVKNTTNKVYFQGGITCWGWAHVGGESQGVVKITLFSFVGIGPSKWFCTHCIALKLLYKMTCLAHYDVIWRYMASRNPSSCIRPP